MSTRNIRPGCNRPRSTTFSGGIGSTPASEASTTVSSVVSHHRPGRSPLRSSTAPSTVPSVNVTQAGPSHGSISDAWNSANPRICGSMVALFSHASGIIIITACGSVRPPRCSSSSTSSNDAESEAPGVQIGKALARSPGISSEASSDSRARIRFRLPRTVLISPLCAMNRNGWASGQAGKVLVENRECTIATALSVRSSVRSAKNAGSCEVVSMPL